MPAAKQSIGHAHPAAVRTHPGWTVADPPEIFRKTTVADLEAAGTITAVREFFFAAVTDVIALPGTPTGRLLLVHEKPYSRIPSISRRGSLTTKVAPLPGSPST